MKKNLSLIQTSCTNSTDFNELSQKNKQKLTVADKSQCTINNYTRHLAELALHFNEPTVLERLLVEV